MSRARVWSMAIGTIILVGAAALFLGSPMPTAAAVCPPTPTLAQVIALQPTPGPLWRRHPDPVNGYYHERAAACYRGRDLSLIGYVSSPEGLGGIVDFYLRGTPLTRYRTLWIQPSAAETSPGFGKGPFFDARVRPGLGNPQARFAGRWVAVNGHFDDPGAQRCRAVGSGSGGSIPTKAEARAICRTYFVVTSIATTSTPATSTDAPVAQAGTDASRLPAIAFSAIAVGFVLAWARRRTRVRVVAGSMRRDR